MQHIATRLLCTALVAPVLGPLAAQGGWKDLTGKKAPAIHADSWLNTDGAGIADLEGKVWLLEFFATW